MNLRKNAMYPSMNRAMSEESKIQIAWWYRHLPTPGLKWIKTGKHKSRKRKQERIRMMIEYRFRMEVEYKLTPQEQNILNTATYGQGSWWTSYYNRVHVPKLKERPIPSGFFPERPL